MKGKNNSKANFSDRLEPLDCVYLLILYHLYRTTQHSLQQSSTKLESHFGISVKTLIMKITYKKNSVPFYSLSMGG